MTKYTKEHLWRLHQKLPEELRDALWSEEAADSIAAMCEQYQVVDRSKEITELAGQVLLGLILPQDFQKELEGIKISKKTAEKIAHEINRFVFYPVRPFLEQLHKMEIEVSAKVVTPQPTMVEEEVPEGAPEEKQGRPDSYREPLE